MSIPVRQGSAIPRPYTSGMGERVVPELPSPPELPAPVPGTLRRAWAKVPYEQRFRRQRRDLLDAAAGLAVDHGVAGTSVARITSRAGLAKRVFYEHFSDKEACFVELFEEYGAARLRDAVDAAGRTGDRGAVETIHAVIAALVSQRGTDPRLSGSIRAAAGPHPRLAAAFEEHDRRVADLLTVVAIRLGSELPEPTIRLAALLLVKGVIDLATELRERRGALEELTAICCRAFGLPTE